MRKPLTHRPAATRCAALLVLVSLGLVLSACGIDGSVSSVATTSTSKVVVSGTVTGYGGPIHIVKGKVVDTTPWPIADMAVTLTRVGSHATYSVHTGAAGTFSITVPRGHYEVAAGCGPGRTQSLAATADTTASVHLACDYP